MRYETEAIAINIFLKDTYNFPRYQRKQTWGSEKNFELAISVFQNYPIGVLILDDSDDGSWLLDGRQRHEALDKMVNDPTKLYEWACSYLGIEIKDDKDETSDETNREIEFGNLFWDKIEEFLNKEDLDEENKKRVEEKGKKELIKKYDGPYAEIRNKYGDLNALLNLVLMVHRCPIEEVGSGKNKKKRVWESLFDFRKNGATDMPYLVGQNDEEKGDMRKVSSTKLIDFLMDYVKKYPRKATGSREKFIEYCRSADRFVIDTTDPDSDRKFLLRIENDWESKIKKSIEAIIEAKKVFARTKIALITLIDADPSDSLNVFSRINSNGVKLSSAELLSAKPFWNKRVIKKTDNYLLALNEDERDSLDNLGKLTKKMYGALGVMHEEDEILRWDIAATLIEQLEDASEKEGKYQLFLTENQKKGRFMGFKLLSSIFCKGMSKIDLDSLEKKDIEKEIWGTAEREGEYRRIIPTLIEILNIISDPELPFPFFDSLGRGKKTIADLLGEAPAFEFVTILYNRWTGKYRKPEEPKISRTGLIRDAFCLFDRLVFEKLSGEWGSAGDSTLKIHLTDWQTRLKPIPYENTKEENGVEKIGWESFIKEASKNGIRRKNGKYADMAPLLYYIEALKGKEGFPKNYNRKGKGYDIDHIIPQHAFEGNTFGYNADCLANLSLLPKTFNKKKGKRKLSDLDGDTADLVALATGIPKDDFSNYENLKSFGTLIDFRTDKVILPLFLKVRKEILGDWVSPK